MYAIEVKDNDGTNQQWWMKSLVDINWCLLKLNWEKYSFGFGWHTYRCLVSLGQN